MSMFRWQFVSNNGLVCSRRLCTHFLGARSTYCNWLATFLHISISASIQCKAHGISFSNRTHSITFVTMVDSIQQRYSAYSGSASTSALRSEGGELLSFGSGKRDAYMMFSDSSTGSIEIPGVSRSGGPHITPTANAA